MPVAVPSLTCGVQPPSAPCGSVRSPCSSNRIAALLHRARRAESTPPITSPAQPQLRMTSPTNDDPKALRPHATPIADFWTRSSRCDEGAGLHRTEIQKARELALSGFHYFRRPLSIPPATNRPKSAPVNGERRPPPSRDLHRLSADRGARSHKPSLWRDPSVIGPAWGWEATRSACWRQPRPRTLLPPEALLSAQPRWEPTDRLARSGRATLLSSTRADA